MKKYLFMMGLILTFMCPSISFAENESILSMEELTIQVMPEYAYHPNDKNKDQKPLLIGYQGSMVNNSNQPQKGQIELPLPMKEKNFRIGYVADYSSDLQKTYEIEYIIDREKGTISWATSEVIAPKERYKFVVELYIDRLEVNDDKKSLTYTFKSFAEIGLVNVSFTVPPDAKKVKLSPTPKKLNHDEGDNKFSYLFQNIKTGDEKSFKVNYLRNETKPVTELVNAKNMDKEKEAKKSTIFAIGTFTGVGVLAVGVGAFTMLIRNRKKQR